VRGIRHDAVVNLPMRGMCCCLLWFASRAALAETPTAVPDTNGFHGFVDSPTFHERIASFTLPEVKVQVNAPPASDFGTGRKLLLIIYTLPNGNTIAHTVGHRTRTNEDWHYDIQHIGAQTRFLRQLLPERNVVVAYLEANAGTFSRSWPSWRKKNGDAGIPGIVASVRNIFTNEMGEIVLAGHSGGGSFIFGYLNAVTNIPDDVARIAFLDSTYAYDRNRGHTDKLRRWLERPGHSLCVLAYDDMSALLNGKPFIGEGGTWGRSHAMFNDLSETFKFIKQVDGTLEKDVALDGRIEFLFKSNPEHKILHTVQVERNGFIEAMVSGTTNQGNGYQYFGDRAYGKWIDGR
jgi:hypothetical protein